MNQNDDREGRELSDELEAHRKQLDELAGTEVVNVARFVKMLECSAGLVAARTFIESLDDISMPRPAGCVCTHEEGDSLCPVHPTCEGCGLPMAPENLCECESVDMYESDEDESLAQYCNQPHDFEPIDLNDSNDFEVKP